MRHPMIDPAEEIAIYPNTGRFLLGRLRDAMSEEEKTQFEGMVERTEWIDRSTRLVSRGSGCDHSTILIDGFMLRTLDGDGKRHAVSFHVPGDFVDLHCFALKRLDHNIDTVGRVKVGYISHSALGAVMRDKPHLTRLFWFSTLLDAAMHREWIMTLEQLTAPRRIAHIFAEIWRRLQMVGLHQNDGFDTPLTQIDLSEMCGATAIHTNRAIRDLRQQGLADFDRGKVTIPDRDLLEAYAGFSPDYLYGPGSLAYDRQPGDPI
jgi:CRP-like cAMP-binding protein